MWNSRGSRRGGRQWRICATNCEQVGYEIRMLFTGGVFFSCWVHFVGYTVVISVVLGLALNWGWPNIFWVFFKIGFIISVFILSVRAGLSRVCLPLPIHCSPLENLIILTWGSDFWHQILDSFKKCLQWRCNPINYLMNKVARCQFVEKVFLL